MPRFIDEVYGKGDKTMISLLNRFALTNTSSVDGLQKKVAKSLEKITKTASTEKQIPKSESSNWFSVKGIFNPISGYSSITVEQVVDNNVNVHQDMNRSHSTDSGISTENNSVSTDETSAPELSNLVENMQTLKFKNIDLRKRNVELQEHVEVLQNLLVQEKINNAESTATIKEQKMELSKAFAQRCAMFEERSKLQSLLSQKDSTIGFLEQKLDDAITKTNDLTAENWDKEIRIDSMKGKLQANKKKLKATEAKLHSTVKLIHEQNSLIKDDLVDASDKITEQHNEILRRDIKILSLEEELDSLREENQRLKAANSSTKTIQKPIKARLI